MAKYLGLGDLFVKDESFRFGLNAFKVLGGSFAMAKYIAKEMGRDVSEMTYDYMTSQNVAHGQALSMAEVEKAMNVEFSLPNGDTAMVNLALMDSGDQTDEVYEFCAINSDWVLPCKGTSTMLPRRTLS